MPATAMKLKAECSSCLRRQPAGRAPKAEGVLKVVKPRLTLKQEKLVRELERVNAREKIPLSREQEASVFKIYGRFRKNPEVQERIANIVALANLRMIHRIARNVMKKCKIHESKFGELVDAGTVGARTAVRKFDYKLGYKFCTYAAWWMKHEMMNVVNNEERLVRIPINAVEALCKMHNFARDFEKTEYREPTPEEISKGTGLKEKKVARLLELKLGDATAELDPNAPSRDSVHALEALIESERKHILAKCVAGLEPRERFVIKMRFNEELTLKDVGDQLGLCRERIRQIESKAIFKLRNNPLMDRLREG